MKLPLLISVPHAGRNVPEEARPYCILTPQQIVQDGDEGAGEIYDVGGSVADFVTTDVARAIVDLNRAEDDRRADGVVKTHTCWNVPVYSERLSETLVQELLARYHRPYHARLAQPAPGVRLGIDCHTMAATAPPVGPDPGSARPHICLSDAGHTCPRPWLRQLALCLDRAFETDVSINKPFEGGHIIRAHCREIPWMQLELSRAPFLSLAEKRQRVLDAIECFCTAVF